VPGLGVSQLDGEDDDPASVVRKDLACRIRSAGHATAAGGDAAADWNRIGRFELALRRRDGFAAVAIAAGRSDQESCSSMRIFAAFDTDSTGPSLPNTRREM